MKTLDEVIEAEEICSQIDAECSKCPYKATAKGWCEEKDRDALHYLKEYQRLQIAFLKALADLEDNPPLTWEELKQMEGKPVWIDSVPLVRRWVIIKKFHPIGENNNLFDMEVEDGAHFLRKSMGRDTGAWWQAYRKERK